MKRLLAVPLITLGLSISLGAQEPTKAPTSTTKSSAQKNAPSTTPKRSQKRIRRNTRAATQKTRPPDNTVPAVEKPWATFTSEAGRFSVLIPGTPTLQTETVQDEHGPYKTHVMVVRDTKNTFLIGWVDYDPNFRLDRQMELEMNRDVFVTDMKAKLVNSRDVVIDGYNSIEFTAETADKIFRSRVYMVGRRPYQLVISAPKGELNPSAVERFFNSFKVSLK